MTIKQIAEKAGTSRGTVDRVLNGRGNVNPELAKRILDIAERERYQPNQLAQALIRSRQRTHIGMVIPSVGNPFFDEVLRGAQSRARKLSSYGTTLTIREIKGYDAATQLQAMRRLVAEGVDALAVMPLDVPEVAAYLQSLPIPVVTVNTDIDVDRVAFVGCDYYNSGMITGDLVQLMLNGRGRVAAVIGSTNVRGHMDRVRGLRTALESTPEITVDAVLENQDDDDVSCQVLRAYLADHTPDLVCFAAAGIDGGMRAILESGKNIRVLAVDGTEAVLRYMEEGRIAATVTQEPFAQGDETVRVLFDYIHTGRRPAAGVVYTHNRVRVRHSQ